ncbi:MAG: glycoside hydrolase family 3 N-terminal domain-containing protein [Verrucomicrobiota bacterium]
MKQLLMTMGLATIAATNLSAQTTDLNTLISRMSLEEKIGQMVQLDLMTVTVPNSSPIKLDEKKLREAVVTHGVGSFINNGLGRALSVNEWHYVNKTIQDLIRAETANKIPLLYGIDSMHGATYVLDSTLFPQQIAMAATRNPELVRRTSEISAAETRAAGLRWAFAPVLDVGRQALWARLPETYGEDPYLASMLGVASVQGFQGRDLNSSTSVAACLKHYLGYSFPLTGKDRSPALMPDWYLREYFLAPFREAVKAGAKTVMVNSGEVSGVPVHGSKYLLTDMLRGELGFQGVIVSDWEDVIRLHTWHKTADSPAEAVRQAVEAGLDISMVPLDYSFAILLKQLVKDGKVSEQRIDESVRRILQLKADVGLFKDPYVAPETAGQFGKPEYQQVALTAAEEAITLLKNEKAALPLAKSSKVLVTGPAAKSLSALHGCWSFTWQGLDEKWYPKHTLTILDAIKEKIGDANVLYRQGVDFDGKNVDAVVAAADAYRADAIVLCLGENAYAETPGDINDLDLPIGQLELAKRVYASGKPVVLVLVEGRPRVIREIEPGASGIVMAYWPASEGARAVANVLFGDTNPSGKLPFTYPRHANNLLTYDRKYTSAVAEISAPGDTKVNPAKPQWEFGHGLSFTTFALKNLQLSAPVLKNNGRLTITVDVTNTGQRSGKEVVEVYTSDLYASLTPPLKRLRAFTKIELQPGETKSVKFELTAADLAFVNLQSRIVTEPGEFEIMVGDLKAKFRYEE